MKFQCRPSGKRLNRRPSALVHWSAVAGQTSCCLTVRRARWLAGSMARKWKPMQTVVAVRQRRCRWSRWIGRTEKRLAELATIALQWPTYKESRQRKLWLQLQLFLLLFFCIFKFCGFHTLFISSWSRAVLTSHKKGKVRAGQNSVCVCRPSE